MVLPGLRKRIRVAIVALKVGLGDIRSAWNVYGRHRFLLLVEAIVAVVLVIVIPYLTITLPAPVAVILRLSRQGTAVQFLVGVAIVSLLGLGAHLLRSHSQMLYGMMEMLAASFAGAVIFIKIVNELGRQTPDLSTLAAFAASVFTRTAKLERIGT